jgi:hypothetical protein
MKDSASDGQHIMCGYLSSTRPSYPPDRKGILKIKVENNVYMRKVTGIEKQRSDSNFTMSKLTSCTCLREPVPYKREGPQQSGDTESDPICPKQTTNVLFGSNLSELNFLI